MSKNRKSVHFLKFFNSFCPGTSRDRGVCPGTFAPDQSHYREVARWEIFMEQELRFGLDFGRFFHAFKGKIKILKTL